jgi:TfoX/Sxy family transcriptional regulator of competence genes
MAYNELLADRVREIIAAATDRVEEKKMFGGLCFMVNDKMCVTVKFNRIMVRIAPEQFEKAMETEGFEPMVHGGRQMPGFGYVQEDLIRTQKQLQHWVSLALEYNKIVEPAKKK